MQPVIIEGSPFQRKHAAPSRLVPGSAELGSQCMGEAAGGPIRRAREPLVILVHKVDLSQRTAAARRQTMPRHTVLLALVLAIVVGKGCCKVEFF